MTWNELRHFHRQEAVVALWRRLWGPVLSWLTPNRRRGLLALGAVWIGAVRPFDEANRIRKWFGFTPDMTPQVTPGRKARSKMGKSLVAKRDLPQGHVLTDDDIVMKSPGGGLPPYEWENLVGMMLTQPIKEDDAFDVAKLVAKTLV